jgi:hypothetical protein
MRFLRLIVGLVVGVVVVTPVSLVTTSGSSQAAPAACSGGNDQSTLLVPDVRCINGFELKTRQKLNPECVRNRPAGKIYQPGECGSSGLGVEAIGHARAIAYIDEESGFGGASGGVTPDVQWEVSIPAFPKTQTQDALPSPAVSVSEG